MQQLVLSFALTLRQSALEWRKVMKQEQMMRPFRSVAVERSAAACLSHLVLITDDIKTCCGVGVAVLVAITVASL